VSPFDAAWLGATIRLSTPLLFAATGELVAERSGVLNIGLEGMMLVGAFFSFLASYFSHSFWLGVLTGLVAGMALATIMALVSVQARADQIVTGVGLNIVAAGLTTFLYREIFSSRPAIQLHLPRSIALPGLSRIPDIGPNVFRQTALVYLAFLSVGVVWLILYRTTWGLAIRASGEVPAAADTAGQNVNRIRWFCTMAAGALAGVGGAYLSVGRIGFFTEGMSAGRGFIALAAVIFGEWNPGGVLLASLALGAADALQLRLQAEPAVPRAVWLVLAVAAAAYAASSFRTAHGRQRPIRVLVSTLGWFGVGLGLFFAAPQWHFPPQLWLALPYIFALVVLSRAVRRVRTPTALTVPYVRAGAA
jgi:ABC-type uncharacterized transport system permease subunit